MFLLWMCSPFFFFLTLPEPVSSVSIRIAHSTIVKDYADAAISMGLDRIRSEGKLRNDDVTILVRGTMCSDVIGLADHIAFIQRERVDAILGQFCSTVCLATGYYDAYYNVPNFPAICSDPELTDKSKLTTMVRIMPHAGKVRNAFSRILKRYEWDRVAMFISSTSVCQYGKSSTKAAFEEMNVTITDDLELSEEDVTDTELRDGLTRIKERARVIITCSFNWTTTQRLMYAADALGMTSPDYVFMTYSLLPLPFNRKPWENSEANLTAEELMKHKSSFTKLKMITLSGFDDVTISNFTSQLIRAFLKDPWNYNYNPGIYAVYLPYVMYLADTSYLYFKIISELIEQGLNFRDGKFIFERAKNQLFNGWTGHVVMDDNADREPEFWLWDCPPDKDICAPYATAGIQSLKELQAPYWGTDNGLHPPSTPRCGFQGEHCRFTLIVSVSVVVVVVVLAVLVLVGVYMYRRQKQKERDLQMMTWKVKFADIDFNNKRIGNGGLRSMISLASVGRSAASFTSTARSHAGQVFTSVGLYNGGVVAVRRLDMEKVSLTREILVELKMLKDLVHENLNPFIGACVEPPDVCVISTYCSKGSLQDVIENEDIKLDWMFKMSLLSDLVNGLHYLSKTSFKSHGSLRSSNCLIDSRWVLRLSGFGLDNFLEGRNVSSIPDHKKYQKLLWTAPELLRVGGQDQPKYGTTEGDVYSCGIILQELVYRATPFFDDVTPQDIVNRVTTCESPPYRPKLPVDEDEQVVNPQILELMEACWREDPASRPSVGEIRATLKRINKGKKSNILDNMLSMLEKYASNLEGLVQQRTGELLDEKKKTDMLLYRMLPPSAADLLKQGKTVDPEMYDAVTIYFSDIVGFTSLSSSSTPMEVVNLLNDLYTAFDKTIEMYDVYKVETIGDAYMVVSGLPRRNGNRHAPEIADMALSLLDKVLSFKIRHRPGTSLNLRIGLHTGPCAAGVVGQTMPRYCLFGDTVNMASRMESTGEAQKIHISDPVMQTLKLFPNYNCLLRGNIEVKGKGSVTTYWLNRQKLDNSVKNDENE